ncbi:MAG: class I SAM-dependent rRNA methyltransferase, partial [Bacteroidales bacterium]|nr:class I SAM-dependent rRNA methyltransferase [Bacteroidales bacterium]
MDKSKMHGKIILKRGKDQSLLRFHPWVFSGAVAKIEGDPQNGDTVEVYSSDRNLLGKGHFQKGSIIVRMLVWDNSDIDETFWQKRIQAAYTQRLKTLVSLNEGMTNCFRLVHGEGDYLPGLIVDIYDRVAVMQTHSA